MQSLNTKQCEIVMYNTTEYGVKVILTASDTDKNYMDIEFS